MKPYALNTKRSETPRSNFASRERNAIRSLGRELPAVTDWEHFAAWCRQEGRQALPASDETLTLYFHARRSAKKREPIQGLGLLALVSAILGVTAPVVVFTVMTAKSGQVQLSLISSGLLFIGLQVIALGSGWTSRETAPGRAGWLIGCLSSLVALGLGALLVNQGGISALENVLGIR